MYKILFCQHVKDHLCVAKIRFFYKPSCRSERKLVSLPSIKSFTPEPMDKYAIYSYTLKAKPRKKVLMQAEDDLSVENLSLEARFELLFGMQQGADFPVQKVSRGGADKYLCHVVRHY